MLSRSTYRCSMKKTEKAEGMAFGLFAEAVNIQSRRDLSAAPVEAVGRSALSS